MTIDLEELERKAKESARYHGSGEWHIYKGDVLCGNGGTVVCDPGDVDGEYLVAASPLGVLALIERMRRTEAALRAIRDEGLSRDDARDVAREALNA